MTMESATVESVEAGWLVTTPDVKVFTLDNSEDFFNFVLNSGCPVWRGDVETVYHETECDSHPDFDTLTQDEIDAELKYEALALAAWDKAMIYPGQETLFTPEKRANLIWRTRAEGVK